MAADNKINFQAQPWMPLHSNVAAKVPARQVTENFADLLKEKTTAVKFSQHALQRLQSRNLQFTSKDMERINQAVDKIAQKGARESLLYINDIALVVSVKNKTVITAMDGSSAKENIFTNIDSAVIL